MLLSWLSWWHRFHYGWTYFSVEAGGDYKPDRGLYEKLIDHYDDELVIKQFTHSWTLVNGYCVKVTIIVAWAKGTLSTPSNRSWTRKWSKFGIQGKNGLCCHIWATTLWQSRWHWWSISSDQLSFCQTSHYYVIYVHHICSSCSSWREVKYSQSWKQIMPHRTCWLGMPICTRTLLAFHHLRSLHQINDTM